MFELQLLCPESKVEIVSEALMELGALSVSVEDADANSDAENALFGEPGMPIDNIAWLRSNVTALFDTEEDANHASTVLAAQDFFEGCQTLSNQAIEAQDWVRITQSQFSPVPITEDFYIVPSWCDAPRVAKQVIRLDPGLAFGTGTHPTTHMCLKWIAKTSLEHSLGRTLDYGCGSGILAIAAKKYGATLADAVDIDPAAILSTQSNAQSNNVSLNIGLPDLAKGTYNTVLANILASPLKVLAPLLCAHVALGGQLVLAGILERQVDEIKAAYAPFLQLKVSDTKDGWILMTT
jgi:ribosomal protein L11 methyltransferase